MIRSHVRPAISKDAKAEETGEAGEVRHGEFVEHHIGVEGK
jgi:hypothetical protein